MMKIFVSGPFPCKAISKILWRTCESGYVPVAGGGGCSGMNPPSSHAGLVMGTGEGHGLWGKMCHGVWGLMEASSSSQEPLHHLQRGDAAGQLW